jgi:peptidoglycan/LPS O-acetylase OafA/YrhL
MEQKMARTTIYFGGLNGLRFIAATSVIFHHVEEYKALAISTGAPYTSLYGRKSFSGFFFDSLGEKAISLFFVLSGFLITYLLLAEMKKTATISLKKFYFRRILRIWPLYYLVILVAFFIVPNFLDLGHQASFLYAHHFYPWLSLCIFMLPNLLRFSDAELVGGNQTWSVGVEEQFYLVWPLLLRTFSRHIIPMLVVLIGVKMMLGFIFTYLGAHASNLTVKHYANVFAMHWMLFKIEQMAIGAIGAWCLFNKREKALELLYHPVTIFACFLFFVFSMIMLFNFTGETLVEAFVFLVIILNVSTNPAFPLKLTHPVFNRLGNISYGIYMYHTIVITLVIHLLQNLKLDQDQFIFNLLLYTASVAITVLFAQFSYRYFESPFLRLKEKFMVVKSSGSSGETAFNDQTPFLPADEAVKLVDKTFPQEAGI